MKKELLIAAALDDERLLEVLIPGRGPVTRKVRAQIRSFASNPAARGALILGPVGAGKSTIARVISLMRYLHWCPDDKRMRIVQHLVFDGPFRIDKKSLNWFEEMNLTGLTDEMAQAQLFGVTKGAATNVSERRGIFEQAMNGHFAKDNKSEAARITGGVVLLDEIGDFSPSLQPLLLMLLTSAEVFRLGREGDPAYGYSYRGVTLGATWKDPFDGRLRPDLLSRLAHFVIRIPGLNDRRDEFEDIVSAMLEDINDTHKNYLDGLDRESGEAVSRVKIKQERVRTLTLNQASVSFLRDLDWSWRGDLRGLRQILERCFYEGISVSEAAAAPVSVERTKSTQTGDFVRDAIEDICRGVHASTLTREMNRIESQLRARLAAKLKSTPELRQRMAGRLGINDHELKRQLNSLTRERSAISNSEAEPANTGDKN